MEGGRRGFDAAADSEQPGTTISIIHRRFIRLLAEPTPSIRQILGAPPFARRPSASRDDRRCRWVQRLRRDGSGVGLFPVAPGGC